MTDSGAYQILKYGDIDVTNREIVQYQCEIGSNIGVILDIPTSYTASHEEALRSAEITLQRAIEVSDLIEKCQDTLWTLPIQGGIHLDILRAYTEKSNDVLGYGYSLYALGSPTTLLENYMLDRIVEMVATVKLLVLPSYPLHLFGAGHPLIMPLIIALGVDLMDSASYVLYAKDRRYMTRKGTYKLDELSYLPCSCPICSRYDIKEVKEMSKKEVTKMLALHNLYVMYMELKEIKEHIREGRLWEYIEERARAHPAAKKAFDTIKKYLEYIYEKSPCEKPRRRALFILSDDSIYNPKVMISRRKILLEIIPEKTCILLIPLMRPHKVDPSTIPSYDEYLHYCEKYFYYPILGLIPYNLVNTYPFSQFESYTDFSMNTLRDLAYVIVEFLLKVSKMHDKDIRVYITFFNTIKWQETFTKIFNENAWALKMKGITIKMINLYDRELHANKLN